MNAVIPIPIPKLAIAAKGTLILIVGCSWEIHGRLTPLVLKKMLTKHTEIRMKKLMLIQ
jgi:hypothetical protein